MSDLKLILRSPEARVLQVRKRLFLLHVTDKIYCNEPYPAIVFDSGVAVHNPDDYSLMIFQHDQLDHWNEFDGPMFYTANPQMHLPEHGNIQVKRFITQGYLETLDFTLEMAPDLGHPLAWLHIEGCDRVEIIREEIEGDEVYIEVFNPTDN
jgi:hypothetical protein